MQELVPTCVTQNNSWENVFSDDMAKTIEHVWYANFSDDTMNEQLMEDLQLLWDNVKFLNYYYFFFVCVCIFTFLKFVANLRNQIKN